MTGPVEPEGVTPSGSALVQAGDGRDRPVSRQDAVSDELHALLALERERIESHNRRTEVVRLAIEKNDDADRRQFEFQMAQLRARSDDADQKHKLAKTIALTALSIAVAILLILFGMLFFGSTAQSALADSLLRTLAIAVGGFGAISALIRAIKRLLSGSPKPEE